MCKHRPSYFQFNRYMRDHLLNFDQKATMTCKKCGVELEVSKKDRVRYNYLNNVCFLVVNAIAACVLFGWPSALFQGIWHAQPHVKIIFVCVWILVVLLCYSLPFYFAHFIPKAKAAEGEAQTNLVDHVNP